MQERFNQYFTAMTAFKQFHGNVIAAKNDSIIFSGSFNIKDLPLQYRVNNDSKFIIASVSKVFIRYAILLLEQKGVLTTSSRLEQFIPGFPEGSTITIQHLLNHSSGLPRELKNTKEGDSLSLDTIVSLAKMETLLFTPGTSTSYSNIGYFLLHYIIDKTSPAGYKQFIAREIFQPLGLVNTMEFTEKPASVEYTPGFAIQKKDSSIVPAQNPFHSETGNFLSTTTDLFHFARSVYSSSRTNEIMRKMFNDSGLLIQAGGRPGYRAFFYLNKYNGYTVIFLSNYSELNFAKITGDIDSILHNRTVVMPDKIARVSISLPEEVLQKYTGTYTLLADKKQKFRVTAENGKLLITDTDGEKTVLYPENENTFFETSTSPDTYKFVFKPERKAPELHIVTGGIIYVAVIIKE